MTIIGKIVGEGALRIFGRIEGELKASSILIADGAQVEGDIVAQEVTIGGHVKGTIHANCVTLHSSSFVQGDIFHRSLTIEENARFEGASRREDNVADASPRVKATTSNPQPTAQPQVVLIDGNRKLNGPPDNMESYQSAT
jgi:cytoskeletal protein CcmA (bactofilin family)